jgi:hypothetical protein
VQHPLKGALHIDERGDVVADELKVRMVSQVRDIRRAAGDEVVHSHDPVAGGEQSVAQV